MGRMSRTTTPGLNSCILPHIGTTGGYGRVIGRALLKSIREVKVDIITTTFPSPQKRKARAIVTVTTKATTIPITKSTATTTTTTSKRYRARDVHEVFFRPMAESPLNHKCHNNKHNKPKPHVRTNGPGYNTRTLGRPQPRHAGREVDDSRSQHTTDRRSQSHNDTDTRRIHHKLQITLTTNPCTNMIYKTFQIY